MTKKTALKTKSSHKKPKPCMGNQKMAWETKKLHGKPNHRMKNKKKTHGKLVCSTPRKLADPMTPILKLIALIVSISLVFDSIHKIFVCIEKVNTHF